MTIQHKDPNQVPAFPQPKGDMVIDGGPDYFIRRDNMQAIANLAAGIARGDHIKKPLSTSEKGRLFRKLPIVKRVGRVATQNG